MCSLSSGNDCMFLQQGKRRERERPFPSLNFLAMKTLPNLSNRPQTGPMKWKKKTQVHIIYVVFKRSLGIFKSFARLLL